MDGYILRKAQIDAFEGVDKTHFLNPNARRRNKSLGDLTGLAGLGFHLIEVPPGCASTEFHRHYFEEECVYLLEGEAEARIGEDCYPVAAGDFIGYRAGGEAHSLRNTGTTPLKCIVVGQRLAQDVGDYPDLNQRLYRNRGLPWNLVDLEAVVEPEAGTK